MRENATDRQIGPRFGPDIVSRDTLRRAGNPSIFIMMESIPATHQAVYSDQRFIAYRRRGVKITTVYAGIPCKYNH